MNEKHAVIVGGGISGLSAAYFLSKRMIRDNLPLKITVLEASDRFGGVLRTLSCKDVKIEAGADAFYAGRSDATDLCRELGLQDELTGTNPCFRRFFLLKKKKFFPVAVPPSSLSDAVRFFWNPFLSFYAKCRMLAEPFVSKRNGDDESFAGFICRRLGNSFYREIAEPLIRGVYMADPEALSVEAVFPGLRRAEQAFGSLAGSLFERSVKNEQKYSAEFLTLKNGLETLVDALVRELGTCDLRIKSSVRECTFDEKWKVALENGETISTDIVCFAMNACASAKLLARVAPDISKELSGIRYAPVMTVNLIYRAENVPSHFPAFGFFVPAPGEQQPFSSIKWLGRTVDGKNFSGRAFISGAMLPEIFSRSDKELIEMIRSSVREMFAFRNDPWHISVERYPDALPCYETGHRARVARIEDMLDRHPGLFLVGNGFHGFGITDCIRSAKTLAASS